MAGSAQSQLLAPSRGQEPAVEIQGKITSEAASCCSQWQQHNPLLDHLRAPEWGRVPSPPPHGVQPILLLPQALKPSRMSLALCSYHMWEPCQPLAEMKCNFTCLDLAEIASFQAQLWQPPTCPKRKLLFHFHLSLRPQFCRAEY